MEKTWKPTTAGILDIVNGCLELVAVCFLIFGIAVFNWVSGIPGAEYIPDFVSGLLWAIVILSAIIGILPFVGGTYALQRTWWGWALAGSIAASPS